MSRLTREEREEVMSEEGATCEVAWAAEGLSSRGEAAALVAL